MRGTASIAIAVTSAARQLLDEVGADRRRHERDEDGARSEPRDLVVGWGIDLVHDRPSPMPRRR